MSKIVAIVVFLISNTLLYSQNMWTWESMSSLPEQTSNNAVVEAEVLGEKYIYSFGGIGAGKTHSTIHNRSYRMKVTDNVWESIPDIPGVPRKIAMGASYVKGKIYILGGYSVAPNGNEKSYDSVHIYNPELNVFEPKGSAIPIPIDDHVQAVWRDSLIFVVTGWSNSGNKPDVMIYDPTFNSWQIGTSVPNDNTFKAFGASGSIVNDTIYYAGGASTESDFPAEPYLRKGVIDPLNPTNITWTQEENIIEGNLYRSAAITFQNSIFWIGGSSKSYNYNGVAYDGTGGVNPITSIFEYNASNKTWMNHLYQPKSIMDLRGIAKLSENEWIICGGMEENQVVSNNVYKITYNPIGLPNLEPVFVNELSNQIQIYPTISDDKIWIKSKDKIKEMTMKNCFGADVKVNLVKGENVISVNHLPSGMYHLSVQLISGTQVSKKIIIQ